MHDLGWGLEMLLLGMGSIFIMLILLMCVLLLVTFLDRPKAEEPEPQELEQPAEVLEIEAEGGLSAQQLAAISVAVVTHADHMHKQAVPYAREHAPGSRLWASRWVAHGRARQTQNGR